MATPAKRITTPAEKKPKAFAKKERKQNDGPSATHKGIDWLKAHPHTGAPLTGAAALYVVGGAAAPIVDPVVWGALGGTAALVTHRVAGRSGGAGWGRVCSAGVAGIGGWLTFASAMPQSVFTSTTAAIYTVSVGVLWDRWYRGEHLAARRAWAACQEEWAKIADSIGLAGTRLAGSGETKLGYRYRVDVRGGSATASAVVKSDVAERMAAHVGVPRGRVSVIEDGKRAGHVFITVRLEDPWAAPRPIPDYTGVTRSILDPIPVAFSPDSGEDLTIQLFDMANGGRRIMVVASPGGGKTNFFNVLTEYISACVDAEIDAIDLAKGRDVKNWGTVFRKAATTNEAALEILEDAVALIKHRTNTLTDSVFVPSSENKVRVILADEIADLLGKDSTIGARARAAASEIVRKGRSEGVVFIAAGQKGTLNQYGTSDISSMADIRIVLRVNRKTEMTFILPGWEADGMPDMSRYGEGRGGVILCVANGGRWWAGRVFLLAERDAVKAVAAERDDDRSARVEAMAELFDDAGLDPNDVFEGHPEASKATGPSLVKATESALDTIESATADGGRQQWAARVAETAEADRAKVVPAKLVGRVTAVLQSGPATANDLVPVMDGLKRSAALEWLRIMSNQGMIIKDGSGRSTRYRLP